MSHTEAEYRQGTMNVCLFKMQTTGLNKLLWKNLIIQPMWRSTEAVSAAGAVEHPAGQPKASHRLH